MIFIGKNKEFREKNIIGFYTYALFSFFFVLFSFNSFSQDSIPIAKDLTEEKELDFQQFFFKALSEKSIGNYQKAIENLENSNQILTGNMAVYFEFSKNYLLLNKTLLAKEYIKRALNNEPNNIWMLQHLVKIHIKDKNFSDAIEVQEKLITLNLSEQELLVKLYLNNKEEDKAISLMNTMEQNNGLSTSFKRLKEGLAKRSNNSVVEKKITDGGSLEEQFKANKSYAVLYQILVAAKENPEVLLKYSDEGILLFPAQPFVYLMKGKALNYQKKFKNALISLQNGIDFVIEDTMEADFYKEMAVSYKGLGNFKEEKNFIEKSKKIKN
ncbi:MAG: tetratricopeptide repeat protein [Polaribacter sp.]|uniref:tetratricopeptide repeat protein n=1 Tax=Polaribacter sp. TaxID=1920175 RepID=UPI003EF936AA